MYLNLLVLLVVSSVIIYGAPTLVPLKGIQCLPQLVCGSLLEDSTLSGSETHVWTVNAFLLGALQCAGINLEVYILRQGS